MTRQAGMHVGTPLMRLQDPKHTRVVIVTLAETTPVQDRTWYNHCVANGSCA
jgi:hypothetical protein